jgi:hypothetical protein
VAYLRTGLLLVICFVFLQPHPVNASDKDKKVPAVRWAEQNPGCTFSPGEDGKYRYGLWAGDIGIIMAIDSQELEKVHRRHEPFFAVLLTIRYRGQSSLDAAPDNISLEFLSHFDVTRRSCRSSSAKTACARRN